jgi:hypothetical protein
MATWYFIQFLFVLLIAYVLYSQIFKAIYKGWPLFWIIRKEAYRNHLEKVRKELEEAELLIAKQKEEALKASEEAEQAEKDLDKLKPKRARKPRRKK